MKRGAERDYSGRSLFEKLGVVRQRARRARRPPRRTFATALNARLAKAASQALRTRYDLIFVRVDAPRDLARLARAAAHLKPERRALGLSSQRARRIADRRAGPRRRNRRRAGRQ